VTDAVITARKPMPVSITTALMNRRRLGGDIVISDGRDRLQREPQALPIVRNSWWSKTRSKMPPGP
jgi:hypothetical protein